MNNSSILSDANILEWDNTSSMHVTGIVAETASILRERNITNIRVVDVGSNIGKFIELLIGAGFAVDDAILIEPVTRLLDYSRTKFPQYKFENRVVSDAVGPVVMFTPNNTTNLGISRIINSARRATSDDFVEHHEATTLTKLLTESYPNFNTNLIKIDAEDFDVMVLDGLFEYLMKTPEVRPIIVFEVSSGISTTRIKERYKTIGYHEYNNTPDGTSRDIFLLPD